MNDTKVEVESRETRSGVERERRWSSSHGRSRAGGRIKVKEEGKAGIRGAKEAAVDEDT